MTPIARKNEDGSVAMVVAGRVTKDAKNSLTRNEKPKAEFSIAYGEKQYLNCISLGNSAITNIASGVEAGDIVLVAGTWTDREYTGRDGTPEHWQECKLDFIAVQQDVSGIAAAKDAPAMDAKELEIVDNDEELPF